MKKFACPFIFGRTVWCDNESCETCEYWKNYNECLRQEGKRKCEEIFEQFGETDETLEKEWKELFNEEKSE